MTNMLTIDMASLELQDKILDLDSFTQLESDELFKIHES